ncbi:hypothetical protein J3A78_004359 [Streptomyces sp. PvR006]|nr:hypothetical protein [Streptomyces sp. PvR006]
MVRDPGRGEVRALGPGARRYRARGVGFCRGAVGGGGVWGCGGGWGRCGTTRRPSPEPPLTRAPAWPPPGRAPMCAPPGRDLVWPPPGRGPSRPPRVGNRPAGAGRVGTRDGALWRRLRPLCPGPHPWLGAHGVQVRARKPGPGKGHRPLCPPVPPQRNDCPQRGGRGWAPLRRGGVRAPARTAEVAGAAARGGAGAGAARHRVGRRPPASTCRGGPVGTGRAGAGPSRYRARATLARGATGAGPGRAGDGPQPAPVARARSVPGARGRAPVGTGRGPRWRGARRAPGPVARATGLSR